MQAEAEEAERRARIQMEVKKSLTHILLDVTDSLFGESAALYTFIMLIYSITLLLHRSACVSATVSVCSLSE